MSPRTTRDISDRLWKEVRREIVRLEVQSAEGWAKIASKVVAKEHREDWHWRLQSVQRRCAAEGLDCPYTATYLVQLAETYTGCEGNLDRGIKISTLVAGHDLPNLLEVIEKEPNISTSRMLALAFKARHDDPRDVDDIEAEILKARRRTGRSRTAVSEAARLARKDLETLLSDLYDMMTVYTMVLDTKKSEDGMADEDSVRRILSEERRLSKSLKSLVA